MRPFPLPLTRILHTASGVPHPAPGILHTASRILRTASRILRTASLLLLATFSILLPCTLRAQDVMVEEYRFGDFTAAEAISVDQFGDIYIVDGGESLVRKYDRRGTLLADVGGPGWDDTQFDQPMGIDASLGIAVYVADMGNHRISRFDRGLRFMAALSGEDESGGPGFRYPLDVVNSPLEELYVLDGENNRVLVVTGFDRTTASFGGIESGAGRLTQPVALAMGGERLYVLESQRVAAFDLFGNFLFHFGTGQFSDAQDIAVLPRHVLVVGTDALHWFTRDGKYVRSVRREEMVLAGDAGEFRGAAYTSPFLLILATHSCILFPNN